MHDPLRFLLDQVQTRDCLFCRTTSWTVDTINNLNVYSFTHPPITYLPLIMEHPHDNAQSATPEVTSIVPGLSPQTLSLASLGAAVIFMACTSAQLSLQFIMLTGAQSISFSVARDQELEEVPFYWLVRQMGARQRFSQRYGPIMYSDLHFLKRLQLAYNHTLPTHTSLQTNSSVISLTPPQKTLRVVDIPGHPRVRDQFQEQLPDAKAVAFVVDASTVSRNGAAVAECVGNISV